VSHREAVAVHEPGQVPRRLPVRVRRGRQVLPCLLPRTKATALTYGPNRHLDASRDEPNWLANAILRADAHARTQSGRIVFSQLASGRQ
jgi:hypothetical protein